MVEGMLGGGCCYGEVRHSKHSGPNDVTHPRGRLDLQGIHRKGGRDWGMFAKVKLSFQREVISVEQLVTLDLSND